MDKIQVRGFILCQALQWDNPKYHRIKLVEFRLVTYAVLVLYLDTIGECLEDSVEAGHSADTSISNGTVLGHGYKLCIHRYL